MVCSPAVDEYTLVRLELSGDRIGQDLDAHLGPISDVPCFQLLNDGSWEILVQIAVIPGLRERLDRMCQTFMLDVEYQPLDPRPQDVEYFGRWRAEALYATWFRRRAKEVEKKGWPAARAYYAEVLRQMRWKLTLRILRGAMRRGRAKTSRRGGVFRSAFSSY